MKPKLHAKSRIFSSPTLLKGDAPFLGATVQEWDKAITGNMDRTLAEVKRRAMNLDCQSERLSSGGRPPKPPSPPSDPQVPA